MEATEKLKLAVVDYWRTGMPDLLLIGDGRLARHLASYFGQLELS